MLNDNFLKLTNAVYKLLEFFPESDPLKNRAKDKALSIMEDLTLINETSGWTSFNKEKIKVKILEDIEILLGYFWIGRSQGWLNQANCLIISNEYEKIKKEIGLPIELTVKIPVLEEVKKEPKEPVAPVLDNNRVKPESFVNGGRQGKILEFLKKNEKAQVMDLQVVLPDVTKRTIRRDLDELLGAEKITRLGEFNQVFYQLKR